MRYQGSPKEKHHLAVKKIIKYVRGTSEFGVWYSSGSSLNLVGYCDLDWYENYDDRKTTIEACFFYKNNLMSLFRKKKSCISLFIVEAECVTIKSAYT